MSYQACGFLWVFRKSLHFKWKVNAAATGVLSPRGLDLLELGLLTCVRNLPELSSSNRTFEVLLSSLIWKHDIKWWSADLHHVSGFGVDEVLHIHIL